jgi:alpha-ketoglutarate-dependent taurine dioxygenase
MAERHDRSARRLATLSVHVVMHEPRLAPRWAARSSLGAPYSAAARRPLREVAVLEAPLGAAGFGARLRGVDLEQPLTEDDVSFLLETFVEWKVLCIAGQDLSRFSLCHFERFANHVGAPLPHPGVPTRLRERHALQVQSNVVGPWRPGLEVGTPLKYEPRDDWHTDIDYEEIPSSA